MTTDPDRPLREALSARAERGESRGADALLAGARADATALEPAATEVSRLTRHPATLAAAAIILVAVLGGIAATRLMRNDPQSVSSANGFCATLAAPAFEVRADEPDLFVFLPPGISPSAQASVLSKLEADERVATAAYVDQEETFALFQRLFADKPIIIENVTPQDLPTSYRVDLIRSDDADAIAADYRTMPNVYEVNTNRPDARVLDVLVATGLPLDRLTVGIGPTKTGGSQVLRSDRIETARDTAPPEAADAYGLLAETLLAEFDRPRELTPADVAERTQAATSAAETARSLCDLEPPFWATMPAPQASVLGTETTTEPQVPATTEPG